MAQFKVGQTVNVDNVVCEVKSIVRTRKGTHYVVVSEDGQEATLPAIALTKITGLDTSLEPLEVEADAEGEATRPMGYETIDDVVDDLVQEPVVEPVDEPEPEVPGEPEAEEETQNGQ